MRNFKPDPSDTIIINATNVGFKFHGIGVYSLNILKGLTRLETRLRFVVYLNISCLPHIKDICFPENFKIVWVSSIISPDRKFKGHLLRLIYSNYLSLKFRKFLLYNTSQLEINFFRSKQVVTVHDIIPLLFREYHKKQYPYFRLILKYGLKYSGFILTPSNHSKEQLQKFYNIPDNKIKVIYNGANCLKKRGSNNLIDEESSYILYIGRISKMKNIKSVLKAFNLIAHRIEQKLIIVGDDEKAFIRELRSAGLSRQVVNKIIFRQNVSEEEKYNLFSNASLLVYPSLYEGFGLPPVEAMACGCPVIVSNNSSLPEVCGDAAIFINPENHFEIADNILEVLNDEKLRKRMIENGLIQAKHFSWSVSSFEHLNVLEHVLRHSKFPQLNKKELTRYDDKADPIILTAVKIQT